MYMYHCGLGMLTCMHRTGKTEQGSIWCQDMGVMIFLDRNCGTMHGRIEHDTYADGWLLEAL